MRLLLCLTAVIGVGIVDIPTAAATDKPSGPCEAWASMQQAGSTCSRKGSNVEHVSTDGALVEWESVCGHDGAEFCETQCLASDGKLGVPYYVYVDGVFEDQICWAPDSEEQEEVTPDRILRAFQRLEWPASELIVEPPDGRTLVNFETNFLTDNTESIRQQVTLLGQGITIEAWPESYTWEFGDGASLTTESAGARYPDLEVTHRYLQKASYEPRVATTYAGRYRVGGGPWVDIPGTHTVEGESVGLDVIEARPVLVAPDGE